MSYDLSKAYEVYCEKIDMPTWIDSTGEKMEYLATTDSCHKEKGNNPMREKYDEAPSTKTASITASSAQVVGSNLTITGPEMVAEEQRKFLARRALDTIAVKNS